MDQIRKLLASLSIRQRWTIGIVALAIVGLVIGFSQWQRERNFHSLYTSLSPEDAGVVVQKLRESNTEYRLSDNGTSISVPSARVAELRLELAAAGVPKSGRIGFELFDKTNFGMTEFTEHVNFRRALEGELERSVMSLSEVEQARVHLTFPKESVFLDSRQAAKASVLVKLRIGARLAPPNILAITHLVSSAVEGLAPEAVAVLDMRGNLLSRTRLRAAADGSADSEAAIEYQQKLEKDVIAKINATLEPVLGAERFRTAASVECDLTSGEQSEETFDPTRSVMATSARTEDAQGAGAGVGGQPGTASNLPRPPAKGSAGGDGISHRTEQITYQTSRTMRHVKLPQGSVKRLSVAVLLDQDVRWDGVGTAAKKVLIPVPAEKIKTIHELVAAAIGLSTQRGDQLTIESLPFESTLNQEQPEVKAQPPVQPSLQQRLKDPKMLVIIAGATVGVLLLIGFGFLFVMRANRKKKATAKVAAEAVEGAAATAGTAALAAAVAAGGNEGLNQSGVEALFGPPEPSALDAPNPRAIAASRVESIASSLRGNALKEAELFASIVKSWLQEEN